MRNEDRENAALYLKIGTSNLLNGDYPQALIALLKAESLDPENPVIQNNLGLAYYVRDKFDLAEKHMRKAIALKSDYSDAKNNLAKTLIDKQSYGEARRLLLSVVDDLTYTSPEKPLINLGIIDFNNRKFQTAKDFFSKSIALQKDNCMAHNYYGRSLYELGDYTRAAEALDRAAGFCKRTQFDEPQYYSALTYYQLGEKNKAEARFEELIKAYPQGKYLEKSKTMLDLIHR